MPWMVPSALLRLDIAVLVAGTVLVMAWLNRRHRRASRDDVHPLFGVGHLAVIAMALVLGGTGAELAFRHERRQLAESVQGYVPIYAAELAHRGLTKIGADTPADDPLYLELIDAQKVWHASNTAVADIYTVLRGPDGQLRVGVDAETDFDRDGAFTGAHEARRPVGAPYTPHPGALRAFGGTPTFQTEPYTNATGTWVSAFVPVRDASGAVNAVVGVDFPAHTWIVAQSTARLLPIMCAAVVVLLAVGSALREAEVIARADVDATARAREALLANVSHEMRTPLNGILGLAELLDTANLSPKQRDRLATLRESAQVLQHVIHDVLDLSTLRAGKMRLFDDAFDLAKLVHGVVRMVEPDAAKKQLELRVAIEPAASWWVTGDRARVRQILLNLVANAVKFTDHGRVEIGVDRATVAGVDVVRVEVADTGIGIDPGDAEKLFRAFEQGDPKRTRRYGGTGLGLTISKLLATQMGGTITASGRRGAGATFTVCLPLAPAPAEVESGSQPSVAIPAPGRGRRILVVEDNRINQIVIGQQLTRLGYAFDLASNGQTAVALSAGQRYALILMDCQMPGMDGLEACRRIRQSGGPSADAPVVALTASAMDGDRERCLRAGMNDYLAKPAGIDVLATVLSRWVSQETVDASADDQDSGVLPVALVMP